MKKTILTILLGSFFIASGFAKTAVVYFSCTGNTKQLAQTAAKATNGDLFEIVPAQAYTNADLNWNNSKSRSSKECNDPKSRPAMKNKINLSGYDTVIIAYPIWWSYAPKIVYTFVEGTDLSGKKVIPICTSGGSGLGNSGKDLEKLAPKADWRKGNRFSSNISENELKKFLENSLK